MTAPAAAIKPLPDHVINQIAAGEVVERPASVMKELVENALDAGATQIQVDVVDGGRKLIRVLDDGSGMDRPNALLSIERHATSKLQSIEDLDDLSTMGFRGEALASISAVSQFTLLTARADDPEGTEILVFGGRIQDVRSAGAPPGTDIHVRNLFFNVPARRRFLRSAQTEFTHIRQTFVLEALANPSVAFVLRADEADVHRLPAAPDLATRVRDIYGPDLAAHLAPLRYDTGLLRVSGLAGLPPFSRLDREWQHTFVNGRPAGSPILLYAIQTAYREALPGGRYAPLFLDLRLPGTLVDVNVHPAKKEVRFRRPTEVRDAVIEAIRLAIAGSPRHATPPAPRKQTHASSLPPVPPSSAAVPPAAGTPSPAPAAPPTPPPLSLPFTLVPPPAEGQTRLPLTLGKTGEKTEIQPKTTQIPPTGDPSGTHHVSAPATPPATSTPAPADTAESPFTTIPAIPGQPTPPWMQYRILGRIHGQYIVIETPEGLALLDVRSAHERIIYEQLLATLRDRALPSQGLLSPAAVPLSPSQTLALKRHLPAIRELGLAVSEFGPETFLVESLPDWISGEDPAAFLSDLADALAQGGSARGTDWLHSLVAEVASRRAVSSNHPLDTAAQHALLRDLSRTAMPYTSPRGRPTVILFPYRELDRKFNRT